MKKLVLLFCLMISSLTVFADNSEGVNWFEGTLDQAISESSAQQKVLFLDFYADWCGPCNYMKNQVFVKPEIYEYMNANFIAYKINTDDHQDLAKKYSIRGIPTFIFLGKNGAEVKRLVGSRPAEKFLNELKEVSNF